MRFTEFLVLESKMSIAHDIYMRAEKEVTNRAGDEGGRGVSSDAILAAAKRIADNETSEDAEAIIQIIADQIKKERVGDGK